MYTVILENRVKRQLKRIRSEILARLIQEFKALGENPRPRGATKLTGTDGWRVRTGDYRILYSINDKDKLVVVYHIGHRREVYR